MKLSEAIAMVEEWLDMCTGGYRITSIKPGFLADTYDVYFEEVFFSKESFITVDLHNRCIYTVNGDDIIKVGRFANDNCSEWLQWYDEFERRWNYGNETTD